jgi:hypothetical protein
MVAKSASNAKALPILNSRMTTKLVQSTSETP